MLFIFSTPELIRNLWQLKTAVFPHWCLICAVPLFTFFKVRLQWIYAQIIFMDGFNGQEVSVRIILFGQMKLDHTQLFFKKNIEFDKLKNLANLDHTCIIWQNIIADILTLSHFVHFKLKQGELKEKKLNLLLLFGVFYLKLAHFKAYWLLNIFQFLLI